MPGNRIRGEIMVGPGASSAGAMRLPGARERRWNPDEHAVQPEARQELVRGELVEAQPARPGHGDTHTRLGAVVFSCVAPGWVVSTDLLTRRSASSDFATDTCVRKAGRDPATGYRYLEELSFEIFFTQALPEARERARDVIGSGVRRMFGLFVTERYRDADVDGAVDIAVREWSHARDEWVALDLDATIEDPCLRTPLLVRALVEAAAADDAIARALIARRNRVIEKLAADSEAHGFRSGAARGKLEGKLEGKVETLRWALLDVLTHHRVALDDAQAERIASCQDPDVLQRWFTRALTSTDIAKVLA